MGISKLDPELFQIREENGLRLITPSHGGAVANAPWTPETLQYRSRVECLDARTVSQGFKKFFNLGHGPVGLNIGITDVARAVENGTAIATLKVDGSLLIRSEWEGKVMLRTRGSFGYEHLDNADEMEIFREKYPKLFEVTGILEPWSLLFEWVSPQNVIVLKYPEPELTLIGAVRHPDMKYERMVALKVFANWLNMPLVEYFRLDAPGWAELQRTLDARQDIEGYVIRLNGEQNLVKMKAAPYLTKHALKSTLTTEKLADMYFQQGRPIFIEFVENFRNAFDEETCAWALGAISNMYDGIKTLMKIEDHMAAKALSRKDLSRKEAALAGLAEYGQTKRFSAYMNLWEGKPIKDDLLKSILLQNCKQVEISMFDGMVEQ